MIRFHTFREMALSLPETTEQPHFEKTSFRVGKKIFATYDAGTYRACVRLTEADQDVFCTFDRNVIYPVGNKWGKQGWTFVQLDKIKKELLKDMLTTAYCTVAGKRLVAQVIREK